MDFDLDTFLVTVYCIVDDLYRAHFAAHKPPRPGPAPTLSDSELLTLALIAQWHPRRSERAAIRYAAAHWRAYFPALVSQSSGNRRIRDLCGVLAALAPLVGALVGAAHDSGTYTVLDAVPVPVMRRCRGERHRLFAAEATIGHGGSDGDWYYGMHLLTAVSDHGAIMGWLAAPADTDVRWSAETLLRWRRDPTLPMPTATAMRPALGPSHRKGGGRRGITGPVAPLPSVGVASAGACVADRGFRGAAWQAHWRATDGVAVLTRADYRRLVGADRQAWERWLSGVRQVIERVNGALTEAFGLAFPRARSWWGVLTRLGAKVAAHNLLLLLNLRYARPAFASFDPFG